MVTEAEDAIPSFAYICLNNSPFKERFHHVSYKTAEVIHILGTPIKEFGIVTSGRLKTCNYTLDGTEMCSSYFESEDVFPELLYFSNKKEYSYTLIAATRSSVAWIDAIKFESMLKSNNKLMFSFLIYMSKRGLLNQTLLCCLRYHTVQERIAYWLLGMDKLGSDGLVTLPPSQSIWANTLRISRSCLNQELKHMQEQGYLSIQGHHLKILDRQGLEDLI